MENTNIAQKIVENIQPSAWLNLAHILWSFDPLIHWYFGQIWWLDCLRAVVTAKYYDNEYFKSCHTAEPKPSQWYCCIQWLLPTLNPGREVCFCWMMMPMTASAPCWDLGTPAEVVVTTFVHEEFVIPAWVSAACTLLSLSLVGQIRAHSPCPSHSALPRSDPGTHPWRSWVLITVPKAVLESGEGRPSAFGEAAKTIEVLRLATSGGPWQDGEQCAHGHATKGQDCTTVGMLSLQQFPEEMYQETTFLLHMSKH